LTSDGSVAGLNFLIGVGIGGAIEREIFIFKIIKPRIS
jgi:hypothetical protein